MSEEIDDYFNKGILLQGFYAERNIIIWKNIAEEVAFLEMQEKKIQDMYCFLQQAAQTNFILSLGKLFDNPNKRYPNRCIQSFLKLISTSSINKEIIETTSTIKLLKDFNCPEELIESVGNSDKNKFPGLFATYYLRKYDDKVLKNDISILKKMRDKAVAHNEVIGDLQFEFITAERLLSFVSEIISIFGMAYYSTRWTDENFSFIKINAERNANFINYNIEKLKKEITQKK